LHSPRPARKNEGLPLNVREFNTDDEIAAAYPLMLELRDRLREETGS
jgi:hypothetical protein